VHKRNLAILGVSQALGIAGTATVVLLGSLVGAQLAPSRAWATLPGTVMIIGVALSAVPAALLMRRIGRRAGFAAAAAVASAASFGAAYAIAIGSFFWFCLAALFIGMNLAFVQQYRFGATESASGRDAGKAVSIVLLGGVAGAFLGPEISMRASGWLPSALYSGSFASMAVLFAIAAVLLLFFDNPRPAEGSAAGPERPLKVVLRQPTAMLAVWSAAVGASTMSFIMTATPISMHVMDEYSLYHTTLVMQVHGMAMYLPSLFSGFLVDRLGPVRLLVLGALAMCACVVAAVISHALVNYLGALILLGIGWNFIYVGATVLLTKTYYPKERFKVQGVNDFTVYSIQALATALAGTVIVSANWEVLNLLTLPLLLLTVALVLLVRREPACVDTAATQMACP
jgi:MFS family permease